MTPPDPDVIAAAVEGCASVAALSGGPSGTVATYLPGRRVTGVRILEAAVEVHVVGAWGTTVVDLAAEIRSALLPLLDVQTVEVVVEDLSDPSPARLATEVA